MKRLLNIALLLALALFGASAQVSLKATDVMAPPANGTILNGTGAYHFRTSPSKMDLNGSERISDGNYESAIATITGFANSAPQRSTFTLSADFAQAGTNSGKIKVTDVGAAYARLGTTTSLNGLEVGKKYTAEAWAYVPGTIPRNGVSIRVFKNSEATQVAVSGVPPANDAWAKLVVNFEVPSDASSLSFRLVYSDAASVGDSIYFDNVSLTQAFDGVIAGWVRPGGVGTNVIIYKTDAQANNSGGWGLESRAANTFRLGVYAANGTAFTELSGGTYVLNNWTFVVGRIVRGSPDTIQIYSGGVLGASTTNSSLGNTANSIALSIGARVVPSASIFYAGQIGEFIFVRYPSLPSDIASWITAASNSKLAIPFPPLTGGGEIVFWTDWQSGGYDKSGNGNHLTPVGGASWGPIQ